MKLLFLIPLIALLVSAICLFIFDRSARAKLVSAINVVLGPAAIHPDGTVTMKAAAAIAEKYLLVKAGTGANNGIATVASAVTDVTIGVCTDEAKAANDFVNVAYHGGSVGTRLVRCQGTVNPGDYLSPDVSGRAKTCPFTAATVFCVIGIAVTEGATGDLVEYIPAPMRVAVP